MIVGMHDMLGSVTRYWNSRVSSEGALWILMMDGLFLIPLVFALFFYPKAVLYGIVAAVVVTAPYWLYQIWAFVLPGLYAQERKMTRIFVAIAGPLFLVGVAPRAAKGDGRGGDDTHGPDDVVDDDYDDDQYVEFVLVREPAPPAGEPMQPADNPRHRKITYG